MRIYQVTDVHEALVKSRGFRQRDESESRGDTQPGVSHRPSTASSSLEFVDQINDASDEARKSLESLTITTDERCKFHSGRVAFKVSGHDTTHEPLGAFVDSCYV
jgi:hypothetical protein